MPFLCKGANNPRLEKGPGNCSGGVTGSDVVLRHHLFSCMTKYVYLCLRVCPVNYVLIRLVRACLFVYKSILCVCVCDELCIAINLHNTIGPSVQRSCPLKTSCCRKQKVNVLKKNCLSSNILTQALDNSPAVRGC